MVSKKLEPKYLKAIICLQKCWDAHSDSKVDPNQLCSLCWSSPISLLLQAAVTEVCIEGIDPPHLKNCITGITDAMIKVKEISNLSFLKEEHLLPRSSKPTVWLFPCLYISCSWSLRIWLVYILLCLLVGNKECFISSNKLKHPNANSSNSLWYNCIPKGGAVISDYH